MDISKLRKEHPKLLNYLQNKGYCYESKRMIKKVLGMLFENEGNYQSYEDFYAKFVSPDGLHSANLKFKRYRIAVRAIYAFNELERYPDGIVHGIALGRKNSYTELIPPFKLVIDNYKIAASKTEKRAGTISSEANNCSTFLFAMQQQGATSLNEITDVLIQSFFFDGEHQLRGASYKCNIAAVLKANTKFDTWPECRRIMNVLPPIRVIHKNYPYLKKDEISQLQKELETSESISLRDKAIVKLLFYTGIRGVDISNMSIKAIDWRTDRITLIQSKTGAPLSLPLRATLGNAIFEYIKSSRSNDKDGEFLFVNSHCPEKGLEALSIGQIVRRVFERTGIRQDGLQKGVRVFRHHLASCLLEEGVQTRIISDILGHLSPLSLNPYIDADIVHLRECGLSIAEFPVREEVFE